LFIYLFYLLIRFLRLFQIFCDFNNFFTIFHHVDHNSIALARESFFFSSNYLYFLVFVVRSNCLCYKNYKERKKNRRLAARIAAGGGAGRRLVDGPEHVVRRRGALPPFASA
jgi:hypothetical protein